jgi:hypothetical protein
MSDLKNTINRELNRAFNKEASNLSFGPNGTNDIKNYTSMMTDLSSAKKEVHEDDEDIEKEETKEATGAGSAGGFEVPLFSEPKKNNLFQPGTETKLTTVPEGGPVNEDEIPGGLTDGMTLKDIAKHHDTTIDELIDKVSDGVNVEMEHTSSIPIALEIALDHIYEDLDYYGKLKKIEATEATTSASVGAYDAPIGGGRKDPLQIDTPKSVYSKLRSVKDPKFPKLGGTGGTFVKVKDKCKKFPYCNQGDIKALEFFENNLVKEGIKNISSRYNLNEDYIKGVILENTNIYYKNTNMNKEIENMIDGIVEKVLSEEINKKAKQVTESVTEEIDEMEEFYEIALKRKKERMEAKNAKPDFLDLDGDGDTKEPMKKAAGETDEEVEEGNEFSGARQDAIDAGEDEFEVNGKKYPVKESLNLTEEEMIDLIERIIQEEKIEGIKSQDSAMKQSKKETDSYMKDLMKKFKDYLKDGSEGKFDMEPKEFPKGNNELGGEERFGYSSSDSAEEYLKHLSRAGGMENLQTDEISYDEERIDKYINGHSETGNSSEYANAIPTDVNSDDVDERRKENLYTKAKKHTSYKRVPQPVTDEVAGHKKGNAKLAKLTSEQENKKEIKLNENIERMKQMFSHNFKSQ